MGASCFNYTPHEAGSCSNNQLELVTEEMTNQERSPSPGTPGGVRWRRGEGLRPGSVAPEGAILLQVVYFGLHV